MQFKISKELLDQIDNLILHNKERELHDLLSELHYADIAEIMEELERPFCLNVKTVEYQLSEVIDSLNSMGYPQKGENSVFKQAKSYVSCAIGKMS